MAGRPPQPVFPRAKEVPIGNRFRIYSLPFLGLVLTGFVASGLVGLLAPFLRFCVLFLLFSLLSGESIRSVTWGKRALPLTVRLPLGFLLGVSFYALVGCVCALLGLSFSTYTMLLQAVAFALFGFLFVLGRRIGKRRAPDAGFADRWTSGLVLAAALATAVFSYVFPPRLELGDSYDHIGYVRAIASENTLFPDGVLAPVAGEVVESRKTDPRKGTFHPLLAAMAALAELEPAVMWRWLPVFLAPVAVLAFFAFARALLPGAGFALAALTLFFLFQGGVGAVFLATTGYGQHLALVGYWLLLALTLDYGRKPARGKLVAIMMLLVGSTLVHFDVLIHFGLLVLSLVVFSRVFSWPPAALVRMVVASTVCAAAVLIWKLTLSYQPANTMHAHPQGLMYFFEIGDAHFVPSPVELLKKNGLLFLTGLCLVPTLPAIRKYRRSAMMCLALATPPILIAMNPWLAPVIYKSGAYLVHRFLLNVPAHVITVLLLGSLVAWARAGNLPRKVLALVALFFWAKIFLSSLGGWSVWDREVSRDHSQPHPSGEMGELIEFIGEKLPTGSVVLSDPLTSYALTAYADVRVVTVLNQHATPNDAGVFERLQSVRNVISPLTTQKQALRALGRYDVDYVVVNGSFRRPVHLFLADWDPVDKLFTTQKLDGMPSVLEKVYASERITVYAVTGRQMDDFSWFPTLPFMNTPGHVLTRCASDVSVGPILITGASVQPPEAVPGEKIRLTIAYRRRGSPGSPLPLKVYARLEDREYASAARRFPGDKYVRRYIERRQGAFRRYRFDHVPFDGLLTPEMWPLEREIYETITLQLPTDLREAVYDVELKLVHDTLIPNFALRDFIFNDDSYGGEVCTQIRIRKFLVR